MCCIIQHNVYHIIRFSACQYCHRTHMHQTCTISVYAPYFFILFAHSDTKCNRAAMSHRTDRKKITFMSLSISFTDFKQFPACFSCCTDNRVIFSYCNDMFKNFLSFHLIFVGINDFITIFQSTFSHYKSNALSICKNITEFLHLCI